MESISNSTAIVTAAGSGLRMGGKIKKQFRLLNGIPILIRSLSPLFASPLISNIIITAPEEDIKLCEKMVMSFFETASKPFLIIAGGVERQDSVFGALQQCPPDTDLVFVHDAVRPFISLELIEDLHKIASKDKAVVPAARLKNTIKEIKGDYLDSTLIRDRLIQVFTPQVFQYKLLFDSYIKAYNDGYISTDDAALVEHYGAKVRYHLSSDLNLKITDEWDFTLAHLIIEKNILI